MTRTVNSLEIKSSRYVAGGTTEFANDRLEWWERSILNTDASDRVYYVEDRYAQRLDLISVAFFDDPKFWWVIAQLNNIIDPIAEVQPGLRLLIPTKDRLSLLLNNRQGGKPSTKQSIKTISPIIV